MILVVISKTVIYATDNFLKKKKKKKKKKRSFYIIYHINFQNKTKKYLYS